jgi:PAS domain S-box-containing protein
LRERWGSILDHLAEAVTIATSDGKIVYANQAVADMLGVANPEALTGAAPGVIVARFASVDEDGHEIPPDAMPGRRVLRGEESAELLTRTGGADGQDRWFLTKARRLPDEGDIALAVNVVEDLTLIKRAERHQRILAQAGKVLGSSLDYEHTLSEVAGMVVPELADACVVDLPDRQGAIGSVAIAHADPGALEHARELRRRYPVDPAGMDIVAIVLRDGRARVIPAPTDEQLAAVAQDAEHLELMRRAGLGSMLVAPIEAHGERLGTLTLVARPDGRRFGEPDRDLAEELGRRAGMAIANARAYEARAEIAETLQHSLRPAAPPPIGGIEIASAFAPVGEATDMGGDFFEVFTIGEDWMAVIGDVVGKGPAAAAITALARHTVHAVGQLTGDPLAAVRALDARLHSEDSGALCSTLVVHGRADCDTLDVVCAGHPLGFVVRAGGTVETAGEPGPLPGAVLGSQWTTSTVTLAPGDALVVYTDGVTEAVGEDRERFGDQRLAAALAGSEGASARDVVARIERALDAFAVGPMRDDVAILVLRRV